MRRLVEELFNPELPEGKILMLAITTSKVKKGEPVRLLRKDEFKTQLGENP